MCVMSRRYFIFRSGTLKRSQNTLFYYFNEEEKIVIPVEEIEQIFLFGETTLNTKVLNFLSEKGILLHIFNYYGYYTGSFYPRERLISGDLLIKQVQAYIDNSTRLKIAKEILLSATQNIKRNLQKWFQQNGEKIKETLENIEKYRQELQRKENIQELMSIEAHIRKEYYKVWKEMFEKEWGFSGRYMHPPTDPINALISFGNSLLYATILKEIYYTQLNPSISYLHQPSERRYSLALDIAELFKPIFVDRLIFQLIDLKVLKKENHFMMEMNYSLLNENGKKLFVKKFDELLEKTVKHPTLKRNVSYQRLIALELYKLIKFFIEGKEYKGFKVWW